MKTQLRGVHKKGGRERRPNCLAPGIGRNCDVACHSVSYRVIERTVVDAVEEVQEVDVITLKREESEGQERWLLSRSVSYPVVACARGDRRNLESDAVDLECKGAPELDSGHGCGIEPVLTCAGV